ncbi:MAG: phage tail assembly protein [Mesorhizobium sp.]|uniref:phage tail assembly protein n=1 Tax=Mesorhizobium sp. TaxID=1871066 RepID=UPI0007ECC737|nr:phage tail assembly protein [Mesorhizobium sp.]RWC28171.1 MAG: phage tail assembly protein [Mesorhizobium sp.]RWE59834.1 MAG: phage tail assembly protein [Mesorhizobium sp.]TIV06500.1 MAG: phage tail assembly protein [Mesorhizobium sp.]TIY03977.1 MAG: phage tail assembly protein [Mesorhizobium sp.]
MTDILKKTKYPLLESITLEGREVTEALLRRIKGKDIRDMEREDSGLDKTAFIICRLAGWPPEAFDLLDAADIDGLTKIIEGFMGRRKRA